jgi:putative transposase
LKDTFLRVEICLLLKNLLFFFYSKYERHIVYSDSSTWYPEACKILKLKHHLHSPLKKRLIERVIQYFKDRTESFDNYYRCNSRDCDSNDHVYNWIELFVSIYNNTIIAKKNFIVIKEIVIS